MSEAVKFPKLIPDIGQRIQVRIILTPHGPGQPIERIEEATVVSRSKYDSGFNIDLSGQRTMRYDNEKKKWQCVWISNINHTAEIIYRWAVNYVS